MDDLHINLVRNVFPPVGRCIYCGSDGGPDGLREEHIIPYSLGGNAVLEEASCSRCEAITSYLEGYAANVIFIPCVHFIRFKADRGNEEIGGAPSTSQSISHHRRDWKLAKS
jgi:hypothetical protein